MTKKITITLEESLIEQLSDVSVSMGKKKAQIVREALTAYFSSTSTEQKIIDWEKENIDAIKSYNEDIREHGVFSNALRSF